MGGQKAISPFQASSGDNKIVFSCRRVIQQDTFRIDNQPIRVKIASEIIDNRQV